MSPDSILLLLVQAGVGLGVYFLKRTLDGNTDAVKSIHVKLDAITQTQAAHEKALAVMEARYDGRLAMVEGRLAAIEREAA